MKIIRLSFTIIVLSLFLTAIGFLVLYLLNKYDLTSFDSDREIPTTNPKGIILDNLYDERLSGELRIYVSSSNDAQLLQYKLSSGRIKELVTFEDTFAFYYPGKFEIVGNEGYWINQSQGQYTVSHKDLLGTTKPSLIYEAPQDRTLIGLRKIDDSLYFTSYQYDEENLFDYEVISLKDGKTQTILDLDGREKLYIPVGQIDRQAILREYNLRTNRVQGDCVKATDLVKVSCVGLSDSKFWVQTREVSSLGYKAGEVGYIDVIDSESRTSRLLEGGIDEHFDDPEIYDDFVYFISGIIEVSSNRIENETAYGSFKPVYLEKVNLTSKEREQLILLPSNQGVSIEYVSDTFVLLSISESSTNRFDIKPYNLWFYNKQSGSLNKLSDIACEHNEYCAVSFIQYIKN